MVSAWGQGAVYKQVQADATQPIYEVVADDTCTGAVLAACRWFDQFLSGNNRKATSRDFLVLDGQTSGTLEAA